MKATFTFAGGQEAAALLRSLQDSRAITRAARAALREAAQPFVATAQGLAPVDKGKLRESVKVAAGKRQRGEDGDQVSVVIGIDTSVQPPEVVARSDGKGSYRDPGVAGVAVIQEFDLEHGGNPFMRPAWDQNKGSAADEVGRALGPAVEAEAARLARRRGNT